MFSTWANCVSAQARQVVESWPPEKRTSACPALMGCAALHPRGGSTKRERGCKRAFTTSPKPCGWGEGAGGWVDGADEIKAGISPPKKARSGHRHGDEGQQEHHDAAHHRQHQRD